MKKLVIGLGATVIVLVGVAAVMAYFSFSGPSNNTEQGSAPFNQEVVRSFTITSLTYRYSNIIYQESVSTIGDIDIPFTKAYLGVRYDGVMEIGVDASRLTITDLGDTVIITLPAPQILSHTLVPGTTEVLFDVDTVFNRNKIDDYTQLFDAERLKMEERAKTSGMMEMAADSAKEQLTAFIDSLPTTSDITIVVKVAGT